MAAVPEEVSLISHTPAAEDVPPTSVNNAGHSGEESVSEIKQPENEVNSTEVHGNGEQNDQATQEEGLHHPADVAPLSNNNAAVHAADIHAASGEESDIYHSSAPAEQVEYSLYSDASGLLEDEEQEWAYLKLDSRPCFFPSAPEKMSSLVKSRLNALVDKNLLRLSDVNASTLKELATFPPAFAIEVLDNLEVSNLAAIADKSEHIYKQLVRLASMRSSLSQSKEDLVNEMLQRTGCSLLFTSNYRQFAGPPPSWNADIPDPRRCQVSFL